MRKNSDQIIVINSLRGIAALLVCLYHFVIITTIFINNQTVLDVFQFGKKGVHIFFVISGIVIPLSMVKTNYNITLIGRYLLRRFVRIEPPYLVAVALGILYLFVRNHIQSSAAVDLVPSVKEVVLHVGYLIPFFEGTEWISPVFWTLAIEFQYYIFIALLIPFALSPRIGLHWIFNGMILLSPFLVPDTSTFMGWSSYFGLGIFYALYISKKYSIKEFILVMLLCSIVVYFKHGSVNLFVAFGVLSVVHFIPEHKSKIGSFLGKISYSLYLIHPLIGLGFINFMSYRISTPIEKILVVIMALILTILSAYLFWKLIERPSQLSAQKIHIRKQVALPEQHQI